MAASRCSPILFPFFLYFCPKHYIISSKSWLLAYTKCRATLHLDGKFGSKLYYFFLNRAECMGFVVFIVCCHFISLYYLPREGPLLLLQAVQKALSRLIFSFCKDNHFFWESILFLLFFFRSHVCHIRSHVCHIRCHDCRIRSHVCRIRSRVCRIRSHDCRLRSHDSVVIFFFRMFVPHTLPVGAEALKNCLEF